MTSLNKGGVAGKGVQNAKQSTRALRRGEESGSGGGEVGGKLRWWIDCGRGSGKRDSGGSKRDGRRELGCWGGWSAEHSGVVVARAKGVSK